jgi:hypothetical protein
MELKTNKDWLPAGADGAEMDRHIAAALGGDYGARPDDSTALEDAIRRKCPVVTPDEIYHPPASKK